VRRAPSVATSAERANELARSTAHLAQELAEYGIGFSGRVDGAVEASPSPDRRALSRFRKCRKLKEERKYRKFDCGRPPSRAVTTTSPSWSP